MNNKGQTNILIAVMVLGILFGGFTGAKISSLNPFKGSPKAVEKSEGHKEEYFRDKIKGIEYGSKETYKNQNPKSTGSETIGQRIGNVIDSSLRIIIAFGLFALAVLFLTGINLFKYVKNLVKNLNETRKALRQTVSGVQEAKGKMNGEKEILRQALKDKQDEDTKVLIQKLKNGDSV